MILAKERAERAVQAYQQSATSQLTGCYTDCSNNSLHFHSTKLFHGYFYKVISATTDVSPTRVMHGSPFCAATLTAQQRWDKQRLRTHFKRGGAKINKERNHIQIQRLALGLNKYLSCAPNPRINEEYLRL